MSPAVTRTLQSALVAGLLAVPVALTTTSSAFATADGPDYYRVVNVSGTDHLNMRAWPSLRSRVVKRLPFDAREIDNEVRFVRGWQKISYAGRTGWVRARYLAEENRRRRQLFKVVKVRFDDSLNLRARPRLGSFVLGKIPSDAIGLVSLDRCENRFCKVRYGAMRGWVSKKHIAVQAYGKAYRSTWRERRAYARKRMKFLRIKWLSRWWDRLERDPRPAAYRY